MTGAALAAWLADPRGAVPVPAGAPRPAALLAGSFNPLHPGHLALAAAAGRHLGVPVHFELSVTNVDKPPLTADEVRRRAGQFDGVAPLWLTAAPRFAAKAGLFPGAALVVGFDTAERLTDPRYAGGTAAGRDAVLAGLFAAGCRVVVGGRLDRGGEFRTWDAAAAPCPELWVSLAEADFRADVSSTALRISAGGRG